MLRSKTPSTKLATNRFGGGAPELVTNRRAFGCRDFTEIDGRFKDISFSSARCILRNLPPQRAIPHNWAHLS